MHHRKKSREILISLDDNGDAATGLKRTDSWAIRLHGSIPSVRITDPDGNSFTSIVAAPTPSASLFDLSGINFGNPVLTTSTATPREKKPLQPTTSNMVPPQMYDYDGDTVMADLEDLGGIMDIVSHVHGERFTNVVEKQHEPVMKPQTTHPRIKNPSFVMVVDTSFILSHLHLIESMVSLADTYRSVVIIPWATVQELDGLRKSSRRITIASSVGLAGSKYATNKQSVEVASLARQAVNWQFKMFQTMNKGVWGQKKEECIEIHGVGDDAILDCCRYFSEKKGLATVLLSDDRNLCVKANIYQILTVSFEPGKVHTAKVILEKGVEIGESLRVETKPPPSPSQLSPFAQPFFPSSKTPEDIMADKDAHMEDAPSPTTISPFATTPVTPKFPPSTHAFPELSHRSQQSPQSAPQGPVHSQPNSTTTYGPRPQPKTNMQTVLNHIYNEITHVIPQLMHAYALISFDGEENLQYLRINFKALHNLEDIEKAFVEHWFPVFSACMAWDVKSKATSRSYSAPYKTFLLSLNSAPKVMPHTRDILRWSDSWLAVWKSLYVAVKNSNNRPPIDEASLDPKRGQNWGMLIQNAGL